MNTTRVRRLLAYVACGGALAAASVTPPAHADSGDLVAWAAVNGFTGTPTAVITRGSLVCADLAMGLNGEQAARDLWLNSGIADIRDARQFVIAAVVNLCPQYDHRGDQAPAPQQAGFGPVLR